MRLFVVIAGIFGALAGAAGAGAAPESGPSVADAARYSGYVADRRSKPGRSFRAGEPVTLTFVDRRKRFTSYQVCWGQAGKPVDRCWFRLSGRRGQATGIRTPAPPRAGKWVVQWYVDTRLVVRWSFTSRRR